MQTIYVVEDDESIRALLEVSLASSGYAVQGFEHGALALKHMETHVPDAVIMDIMMEPMDGITALRLMRGNDALRRVPVLMLTAKDTETDKVLGLDAGADDYMTKPFSVLELCARVRALLRRGAPQPKEGAASYGLQSGALQLHVGEHEVTLCGQAVELTLKEFMLLQELMECAPDSIARDTLLQKVWGYDYVGETRTLDMHIGTLRAKLQDDSANPNYIKTVRGIGYRFLQNVERVSGSTGRQAL